MRELILVGDRVLIAPDDGERQTKAGLYLPATVAEQERVQSGRVVRVGPGYLMPNPDYDENEAWAPRSAVRYLPLQARVGDYAFFLRKEAITLTYEDRTYLIVPHGAILALVREHEEDVLDRLDTSDLDDLLS
ncbi:MAG: co-chaperone GroES [Bacteroidetes bacterium]|nr:MAG: co-chaperone GroES [Bacteroidota bacterium]GIV57141.1 MAG: chaperonin [Rhodothermaceae bacterium]